MSKKSKETRKIVSLDCTINLRIDLDSDLQTISEILTELLDSIREYSSPTVHYRLVAEDGEEFDVGLRS